MQQSPDVLFPYGRSLRAFQHRMTILSSFLLPQCLPLVQETEPTVDSPMPPPLPLSPVVGPGLNCPGRLAVRALRFARLPKPSIQACGVELDEARPAPQARCLARGRVYDAVANQAGPNALELLVHVPLPEGHSLEHRTVLVPHERRDGEQPLAQLRVADSDLQFPE